MNQRIYHSVTLMYRVFSNRHSILHDIDPYAKKKREPYNRGFILFDLFFSSLLYVVVSKRCIFLNRTTKFGKNRQSTLRG